MALDVLIPQHRQRDVLALELAVDLAPIGLDVTPMTLFGTDRSEQYRFQRAVGHLSRQRPAQPRACQPFQRQPDSRWRNTYAAGNLIEPDPGGSQTKHFAHSAHRQPLCWHPLPRVNPKGRTLTGPAEAPPNRARSSRNGGRNHLGTPSEIKSECWATSSRIRERLPPESASSLNYRDLMVLKGGGHGPTKIGVIPLSDGAGEVAAIGEGVTRVKIGDRIAGCFHPRWFGGPIRPE